jgi:hypothetical protein
VHADHSHDAALLKRFRRATERRLHVLRDLSKRKDALILARNESVPARERAANVRAEPLVQVFFFFVCVFSLRASVPPTRAWSRWCRCTKSMVCAALSCWCVRPYATSVCMRADGGGVRAAAWRMRC